MKLLAICTVLIQMDMGMCVRKGYLSLCVGLCLPVLHQHQQIPDLHLTCTDQYGNQ